MSARVMGWEEWQDRTLMTPSGPLFAKKGDHVFVIVGDTMIDAFVAWLELTAKKAEPRE